MKQNIMIFVLLTAIIFVLSSCLKQIIFSSDGTQIDVTDSWIDESGPPVSSSADIPVLTGDEQNLESDVTRQDEQPAQTSDGKTGPNIIKISLSDTGMTPIPVSDLNGLEINPGILEIINSYDWGIDDFTKGIDMYNNVILVLPRFSEKIVGQAGMGTKFGDIISELGPCGLQEQDLLVYRTSDFYMAFYGAEKADFAAFMYEPGTDYDVDFLNILIEELNSDSYSSFEESMDKLDPDLDFFNEMGSSEGANFYANSPFGINVSDIEKPVIGVMSNYKGNLYIQEGGNIRYGVVFNDTDAVVIKMREALDLYGNISKAMEQDGVLSPDGRFKAVYYSDGYFVVRTMDGTAEDINIYTSISDQFYWLGSRYILYIDDFSTVPSCVDLDSVTQWGESLFDLSGITDSGNGYKITKVENQIISLEDLGSGEALNVIYSFDGDGLIRFSLQ